MSSKELETPPQVDFLDPEDLLESKKKTKAPTLKPEKLEDLEDADIDELFLVDEDEYFASKLDNETQILKRREDYRGYLALIYTIATFLIFVFAMVIAVVDGMNRDVSIIENLERVLPLVSGIFLGTLGFVLGYYFRRGEQQ